MGKEDDENSGLLNCLLKRRGDSIPSVEVLVIDEGVNSFVMKSFVEISSETMTSIFASEAQEHIIGESIAK